TAGRAPTAFEAAKERWDAVEDVVCATGPEVDILVSRVGLELAIRRPCGEAVPGIERQGAGQGFRRRCELPPHHDCLSVLRRDIRDRGAARQLDLRVGAAADQARVNWVG